VTEKFLVIDKKSSEINDDDDCRAVLGSNLPIFFWSFGERLESGAEESDTFGDGKVVVYSIVFGVDLDTDGVVLGCLLGDVLD